MKMAILAALLVGLTAQEEPKKQTPDELAQAHVDAARRLISRGEMGRALEMYREALKLRPDWIQVRMDFGRLGFQKGQVHFFNSMQTEQEAKTLRNKAGKDPQKLADAEALEKRTREEREKADTLLNEAMENFQKVIEESVGQDATFNCHLYIGHIHAFYRRWEKAKAAYEKAKGMKPTGEALEKIEEALELVEAEIEKEKAKEE